MFIRQHDRPRDWVLGETREVTPSEFSRFQGAGFTALGRYSSKKALR